MSNKVIIYHNPRCRKSREALQILQQNSEEVEIIDYLKNPPSVKELEDIIKKLGIKPEELLRKNEEVFKSNFKGKSLSDQEWIKVLASNPILMERPVVIRGQKAVIGRPPEKVYELL